MRPTPCQPRHCPALALLLALLCASASPAALAQSERALSLSAQYSMQTDSNLFRLPAGANTGALIGRASPAERIGTATLGLHFNTTQSLQAFELDAALVDYRYQNFSHLNFTARNYQAHWRWAITPHLRGNLSREQHQSLNSFTDSANLNQRNQRTDTSTRLDASYALDGPWHLLGGLSRSTQSNQQALLGDGDFDANSAELGLRYVFASGSTLGYRASATSGHYTRRAVPSPARLDDRYRQRNHELRLHWSLDQRSGADFYLTHLARRHPHYGQRDYSGFNAGASLNWAITGKTTLNARYEQQLATYANANTNYTRTHRLAVGPVWQISPKTRLSLSQQWAQISYLGTPGAAAADARQDRTSDTRLQLDWQPNRQLTLGASVQRNARSANQSGLDFGSTVFSLNAELTF